MEPILKKRLITAGSVVLGLFVLNFFITFTRIEAGYVGIKVNLFGSERGVQDITEVAGWVVYSPLSSRIYQFPTFIQHKVWTADIQEDSPVNEEFTVTTKDGLSVSFDVGLDYRVIQEKVAQIFSTYRRDLPQITNEFIRTTVRNGYNTVASTYSAEELVSKRAAYEAEVRKQLVATLKESGFDVAQIAIIGKVRLPKQIEEAINSKIQAVQDAMRTENEKQRIVAEASKNIEQARGEAEATRIKSEAEAAANIAVSKTLNPLLVQKLYIEKWDGKMPIYGTVPQLMMPVK